VLRAATQLGDGDGGVEGVAVLLVVVHHDFDALDGAPLQMRQLLIRDVAAVAGTVVRGMDLHARVGRSLVRHDVAPALEVHHAQRHHEVFAVRVLEAQQAGGAAAAHGQSVRVVRLRPRATVGGLPHRLLHHAEPRRGRRLDHPHVDGVRHGDGAWNAN